MSVFNLSESMHPLSLLTDVGFPSVCCEYILLPLVNKEAVWANGLAEYS